MNSRIVLLAACCCSTGSQGWVLQYLIVIHSIQGIWGRDDGRVVVWYVVLQFLKGFLKQVRFMQFLLFPPLSVITLESTDHSGPALGEMQSWTNV